jgi:hypothetical protein
VTLQHQQVLRLCAAHSAQRDCRIEGDQAAVVAAAQGVPLSSSSLLDAFAQEEPLLAGVRLYSVTSTSLSMASNNWNENPSYPSDEGWVYIASHFSGPTYANAAAARANVRTGIYAIEIHYGYNVRTRSVAELGFKNTKRECTDSVVGQVWKHS